MRPANSPAWRLSRSVACCTFQPAFRRSTTIRTWRNLWWSALVLSCGCDHSYGPADCGRCHAWQAGVPSPRCLDRSREPPEGDVESPRGSATSCRSRSSAALPFARPTQPLLQRQASRRRGEMPATPTENVGKRPVGLPLDHCFRRLKRNSQERLADLEPEQRLRTESPSAAAGPALNSRSVE